MKAGMIRAEIAGNHVLKDDAKEVSRDQITHVLLSQRLFFLKLKLVSNIIRCTHLKTNKQNTTAVLPTVSQSGSCYRRPG